MNAVLSLVARLSQIAAILISWGVKLGWRVVTRSPLEGPMMARELFELTHEYPERHVQLSVWAVEEFSTVTGHR